MTESYTPSPGDQVRVRRYEVPTPELSGTAERVLRLEVTGTIATVRELHGGHLITLEGDADPIFTGYQHTGQDPDHGCSWSLHTEVVPLADVAAHDQAELDAQVTEAEAAKARALALWEQARDAEVVARQRLKGTQERLEAATGRAGVHRRQMGADLGALSERRKADRAVMAEHVADLARAHGLSAEVRAGARGPRQTVAELAGPHGLQLAVRFDGDSPQAEPDTYVLSWYGVEDGWRLFPAVFGGSVNPYHGDKATDVAHGFRDLTELLARRFASIADGSAFVPACCRYHELGGRADFPCMPRDPVPAS